MDNFRINITCQGSKYLLQAMQIACQSHTKIVGYSIDPKKGLIFYWTECKDATKLPFTLDVAGAADFAGRWLAEQDYGGQPDHDGDNGKGWRLYNEDWGRIGSQWEAFVAIKPEWAMYGK